MGKDKSGKFHPGKGKPSGVNKEEGLGLHPTDPENLDQYIEMTDKYTVGTDELAPNVPLRHPNRNTSKGQAEYKEKQDTESDKEKNERFDEDHASTVAEELPGILSKELFAEIANYKAECCVSIYIPTHRAGVEINEHFDPIVYKNGLQDVKQKLQTKGIETIQIERMLEPGYELLRDDGFWHKLTESLVVFIAEGYFKYIKMPVVPTEEIVIDNSFFVAPLIPIITTKEYYYLLVISKKQAKFYRADAFGMQYIPIDELPNGVDDVVHFEEKDDEKLFRTGGRGGTGGANFHGIGSGKPDEKQNIALYLEEVDDTLWKHILNKENAPVLLAGVEYLIPIYKQVTDYHNIWNEALTGSHEHEDIPTLYKQTREIMEPYFQRGLNKALEDYGNKSATALTSTTASDIIPATYYAQVSHLFIRKGEHIWGTFDEMANELKIFNTPEEGGEDLLDNAVVKTLVNGGEVFLLEKEKMPAESLIAAILRY